MKTLDQVSREALELQASDRVLLAEQFLDSLDQPDQEHIEALWAAEIERRLARFDRGEAPAIPGAEIFRRLRARVRR